MSYPDPEKNPVFERQPRELTRRIHNATVGIAGCGGLGSVVAECLSRSGIGKLVLVDFDRIEPSNLNRQRFSSQQLGQPKARTLADNIKAYNAFIDLDVHDLELNQTNTPVVFRECSIVVECLDCAEAKAMLINSLRKEKPEGIVVGASGLAGIGSTENIGIRCLSAHLYVVGDMVSEACPENGLFASRVGVVACMQAHAVIRLLSGEKP